MDKSIYIQDKIGDRQDEENASDVDFNYPSLDWPIKYNLENPSKVKPKEKDIFSIDVHRKEKSEKENTFAYSVCEYVPPKRVKKKEFSHRGTNDPETGFLPVDQKVSTPCYSPNGHKVEKLKEKATFNTNLKKHIKVVHEKAKVYVCMECDFAALYKSQLNSHIQKEHNPSKENKDSNDNVDSVPHEEKTKFV